MCIVDPDLMDLFIGLIMKADAVSVPVVFCLSRSQFCPCIITTSPRKKEKPTQCRYNAGPQSVTLAQLYIDIG